MIMLAENVARMVGSDELPCQVKLFGGGQRLGGFFLPLNAAREEKKI